jgi:hypothetical protein
VTTQDLSARTAGARAMSASTGQPGHAGSLRDRSSRQHAGQARCCVNQPWMSNRGGLARTTGLGTSTLPWHGLARAAQTQHCHQRIWRLLADGSSTTLGCRQHFTNSPGSSSYFSAIPCRTSEHSAGCNGRRATLAYRQPAYRAQTLVSQTLWRLFAGQIRREAWCRSRNQYRPDGTAG